MILVMLRKRWPFLILGICIIFKIALWVYLAGQETARFTTNDTSIYVNSALALLETGSFSISPDHPEIPQTVRTPGYPLFLAGVFALFGKQYAVVAALQILIGLVAAALVYKISLRSNGPQAAWLAVFFLLWDIPTSAYALLILSDTLFTFLILLVITAITGKTPIFWAGLALAAAVIVRPVAYYLPFLLALLLMTWWLRQKHPWQLILRRLFFFCVPLIGMVGGWQLRNYLTTGSFTISEIQGINLLYYRGAAVLALSEGISLDEARQRLDIESPWERALLDPTQELADQWSRQGAALIRQHPALYLRASLIPAVLLLFGPGEAPLVMLLRGTPIRDGPLGDIGHLPLAAFLHKWLIGDTLHFSLFVFASLWLLAIYLGAAIFWVSRLSHRTIAMPDILLIGLAAYFVILSAGPEAYFRFRLPLMPLLAVWAGAGWSKLAHHPDPQSPAHV